LVPAALDRKISSYKVLSVRRKPGQLLDLEAQILGVAVDVLVGGDPPEVHGFALAKRLADRADSKKLTAHGTLYKALGRLEDAGLLESRWVDHAVAEADGRPRRRLYRVTSAGQASLAAHVSATRPAAGAAGARIEPA
jgi:DNA-binding PadR family transcriptional regulator